MDGADPLGSLFGTEHAEPRGLGPVFTRPTPPLHSEHSERQEAFGALTQSSDSQPRLPVRLASEALQFLVLRLHPRPVTLNL